MTKNKKTINNNGEIIKGHRKIKEEQDKSQKFFQNLNIENNDESKDC